MIFFEIFEFVCIICVLLFGASQFLIPIITGKSVLPMFRGKDPVQARVDQAKEQLRFAEARAQEAEKRKITAEKNLRAAMLETEAEQLDERAEEIREKSLERLL